jgi:hypothetical protein
LLIQQKKTFFLLSKSSPQRLHLYPKRIPRLAHLQIKRSWRGAKSRREDRAAKASTVTGTLECSEDGALTDLHVHSSAKRNRLARDEDDLETSDYINLGKRSKCGQNHHPKPTSL